MRRSSKRPGTKAVAGSLVASIALWMLVAGMSPLAGLGAFLVGSFMLLAGQRDVRRSPAAERARSGRDAAPRRAKRREWA